MTTDRHGHPVTVGMRVRVTGIDPSVTRDLPGAEGQDVASMLGEVFEVYEIDERGAAWVEKQWPQSDGASRSHSLALDPREMEVVVGR
jgi:hypothetical protein